MVISGVRIFFFVLFCIFDSPALHMYCFCN